MDAVVMKPVRGRRFAGLDGRGRAQGLGVRVWTGLCVMRRGGGQGCVQ
jgi:hypothetical protein